jgi:glycosyltransferase involved in cell wall biosynthesis
MRQSECLIEPEGGHETLESRAPHICFFGLDNLSVLAREYGTRGVGGEQVQQTLLARATRRVGCHVSMITADYGQPDGQYWDGIQVFKARDPATSVPGIQFVQRWQHLWNACQRAAADIYYTSCAGFHLGLLTLYARHHGARVIFRTAHDSDCEPDNLIVPHWHDKQLYSYGLKHAHGILTQTVKQQQALLRNYGLASKVAAMMVEQPHASTPLTARDIAVMWVNNMRDFKRPLLFLDLAARLTDLDFHMIGGQLEGSERLYGEVAARAAALHNVHFHGQIPYHDVNDHYSRARVFVNTSATEGFPNSYLQAWARGTPVVAFFDPDGVIEREQLGAAVASLDEMTAAVHRLTHNEELWRSTSERCRAYMSRTYSEHEVIKPYLELFAQQGADLQQLQRCTDPL